MQLCQGSIRDAGEGWGPVLFQAFNSKVISDGVLLSSLKKHRKWHTIWILDALETLLCFRQLLSASHFKCSTCIHYAGLQNYRVERGIFSYWEGSISREAPNSWICSVGCWGRMCWRMQIWISALMWCSGLTQSYITAPPKSLLPQSGVNDDI